MPIQHLHLNQSGVQQGLSRHRHIDHQDQLPFHNKQWPPSVDLKTAHIKWLN